MFGALRRAMAKTGYSDLKEFQKVELDGPRLSRILPKSGSISPVQRELLSPIRDERDSVDSRRSETTVRVILRRWMH